MSSRAAVLQPGCFSEESKIRCLVGLFQFGGGWWWCTCLSLGASLRSRQISHRETVRKSQACPSDAAPFMWCLVGGLLITICTGCSHC